MHIMAEMIRKYIILHSTGFSVWPCCCHKYTVSDSMLNAYFYTDLTMRATGHAMWMNFEMPDMEGKHVNFI